jgi:hypothetical protein
MGKLSFAAGIAAGLCFASVAALAVPQPHMDAALHALENAKHQIEDADANRDHGGHAEAATKLIEDAIHEVKEGIRFRDEHAH